MFIMFNENVDKFFLRTKIRHINNAAKSILVPTIEFNLPEKSKVLLFLSDSDGNNIFTLINNEYLNKGLYSKDIDFSNLPDGNYCFNLITDYTTEKREIHLS